MGKVDTEARILEAIEGTTEDKILVLDEVPGNHEAFDKRFEHYDITHVCTVKGCIEELDKGGPFAFVFLNYELNHKTNKSQTGMDVVIWLIAKTQEVATPNGRDPYEPEYIIYSQNTKKAEEMLEKMEKVDLSVFYSPFTEAMKYSDEELGLA